MNIFESVKATVSVREAVAFYGIKVNRSNMCCCPFHRDRHPSMKVDDKAFGRFYCFGCGETGDVIDFVGKLFELAPIDAAKKLADDFHVACDKIGQGKEKTPAELKRERECQEQKDFANKKKMLLQLISTIRKEAHDMKMDVEAEAMKVLEAHLEYAEAIDVLQIIDVIQDDIYDNLDEDLMKRWSEYEKEVSRLAERISEIRCRCDKAS